MSTPASTQVHRYHWINTFTGFLDAALHLTEEEQSQVMIITGNLLDMLNIPTRGEAAFLPNPVALEVSCSFYTTLLNSPRDSGRRRPVRVHADNELVVSIEAWRDALVGMLTTAYPDLRPEERMVATRVMHDMLAGLGVPDRAASHFPDSVIRVARQTDR